MGLTADGIIFRICCKISFTDRSGFIDTNCNTKYNNNYYLFNLLFFLMKSWKLDIFRKLLLGKGLSA